MKYFLKIGAHDLPSRNNVSWQSSLSNVETGYSKPLNFSCLRLLCRWKQSVPIWGEFCWAATPGYCLSIHPVASPCSSCSCRGNWCFLWYKYMVKSSTALLEGEQCNLPSYSWRFQVFLSYKGNSNDTIIFYTFDCMDKLLSSFEKNGKTLSLQHNV